MSKNQDKRLRYVQPLVKCLRVEIEGEMMGKGSTLSGGHKKPIVNPTIGDAKQGWFDEEEENFEATPWEEDNTNIAGEW